MDIIVRKVNEEIVAVSGAQRLDVALSTHMTARVKFLSGREAIVTKDVNGRIVEAEPVDKVKGLK